MNIDEVLTRGVDKVYPDKATLQKALESKKLRIYQGFDPTGTQLHIGHMVGLRKLAQFQKLGHHVIFVIGDGTGQAGDPSGKTKGRRLQSLTLSTHSNEPGILRKMLESFEKEGISLEAIKSEKTGEDISFKITIDEEKYNPELVSKVVRSLGSQGFFTNEQLRQNAKSYVKQAAKIIDFEGENKVEILYNGDWLNKLNLEDILNIASHFSLQQLSERDLFQERIKKGEDVNLREFLYPLLQAYDSVVLNVDLEVGGSDQTFNMLCGRTLAKQTLGKEKFVLTTPLLTDSKGVKIGKTEGNVIALTDAPIDLFGKIMSLSDDIIVKGLEYLTDVPVSEIEEIEKKIKNSDNPMQYKKMLAFEIVKQLNNEKAAKEAQDAFESTFQERQSPLDVESIKLPSGQIFITEFLTKYSSLPSTSQVKNLIREKAIEIDGNIVDNPKTEVKPGQLIKVGKKTFIKTK